MPAKTTRAKPTGPFVVINPRGIPAGRHIIRDDDVRYFEGDTYKGDKAEMWLARGFITDKLPKAKTVSNKHG